jgi:hypothetical protein
VLNQLVYRRAGLTFREQFVDRLHGQEQAILDAKERHKVEVQVEPCCGFVFGVYDHGGRCYMSTLLQRTGQGIQEKKLSPSLACFFR